MPTRPPLPGRLLMCDVAGPTLSLQEAEFFLRNQIRAVCLFRRNLQTPVQARQLVADLQAVLGAECLIALDYEGGAVNRATFLPAAPSAMALGAGGDADLARQVGAGVGRALQALGINWNFAPVADLNCNPRNPVIAERSFGADPTHTVPLARAWLQGLQAAGVAGCLKHFPGHGDTQVDSHRALPVVDKPLAELTRYEFAPFRALLPEAASLMSAHIVFPALDPALPATLSRPILSGLLRQDWAWSGVTITDGMNMQAIEAGWGQAAGCALALAAGGDMALQLGGLAIATQTLAAVNEALQSGRLDAAQAQASAQRLDTLAQRFPSRTPQLAPPAAEEAWVAESWRRGLTAVGSPPCPAAGSRMRLVIRRDAPSDGVSEAGLPAQVLATRLARQFALEVCLFDDAATFDWARLPQDGMFTVLASTTRARYGAEASARWKPDLHLVLWNPYAAQDITAPALITYGYAAPALDALQDWLAGHGKAPGRFPG